MNTQPHYSRSPTKPLLSGSVTGVWLSVVVLPEPPLVTLLRQNQNCLIITLFLYFLRKKNTLKKKLKYLCFIDVQAILIHVWSINVTKAQQVLPCSINISFSQLSIDAGQKKN